jgi:predicted ribosome quality control (RQC) complex YloA/Tae2 family protein
VQPVDFTTLTALCAELRQDWLPARLEQVYQRDRHTLSLALRTLDQRGWLTLCWHPQAARLGISDAPPRTPDTFTLSQQLRHQLGGLALVAIEAIAPWERVVDLQFAQRPGEPALWHLYVEIMGKYSNVILTTQDNQVVTAAQQIDQRQSSVRSIQTGQPYQIPPSQTDAIPTLAEPRDRWQERIALVPGAIRRNLLSNYRGLSSALVLSMLTVAGIDPNQSTDQLTESDWQRLYERWQEWLTALEQQQFKPGWRSPEGYSPMGWDCLLPEGNPLSLQTIVHRYYSDRLSQDEFVQLRHQVTQKLTATLKKLYSKAKDFRDRLTASDGAEQYQSHADLLMAHLHHWTPGMKQITLTDFITEQPVTLPLNPEKNAVQNAQALYKKSQKLRRSRTALEPLLAAVQAEVNYLEQVEVAVNQLASHLPLLDPSQPSEDLDSLIEIRDELIQQNYIADPDQRYRSNNTETTNYLRYRTPNGFEVLIGRNNRQNDQLTFRQANDYDLWFHTQEIPGSHVLLRLDPGAVAEADDLQFTADLAAFYSRARQSDQVPVVYTEPQYVFKPKGAKPGIAIYKQERILWGQPSKFREG